MRIAGYCGRDAILMWLAAAKRYLAFRHYGDYRLSGAAQQLSKINDDAARSATVASELLA